MHELMNTPILRFNKGKTLQKSAHMEIGERQFIESGLKATHFLAQNRILSIFFLSVMCS